MKMSKLVNLVIIWQEMIALAWYLPYSIITLIKKNEFVL